MDNAIRLKGGPYDGKTLRTRCSVLPGEAVHIVQDWEQEEPGHCYLIYSGGEARHVANRPDASTIMRFGAFEVGE